MLLVHAALDDAAVVLWTDAREAQAVDLPALVADLLGDGADVEPMTAQAWLPVGDAIVEHHVSAVRLTTRDSIRLLAVAADAEDGALVPGVRAASSLRRLATLVPHAAAAVVRQEVLPSLRRSGTGALVTFEAHWMQLARPAARDLVVAETQALPGACFAIGGGAGLRLPRLHVVDRYLDAVVDLLARDRLRAAPVELRAGTAAGHSLHDRWLRALVGADRSVEGPVDALDQLVDDLDAWQAPLRRRADSPFRLTFRLEEPDDPSRDGAVWYLRYLLQLRADPSVQVPLDIAWSPSGSDRRVLADHGFDPGLHLYAPLGEAARLSEPIAESLQRSRPGGCELDTAEAHAFLAEASPVLEQAGFGVLVPAWWRARGGRWQLNLRANATTAFSGGRRNLDSLNLATLVGYDWRVALGDVELTRAELDQLASQKTPLVHVRGRWVELDAEELAAALAHLDRQAEDPGLGSRGSHTATVGDLLAMSVPGVRQVDGLPVGGVDGDSDVAELLERMARHELPEAAGFEVPAGLRAELRPYQLRGAAWLASMAQLGLGACLADDMGLGKTVQTLAVVLDAWERDPAGGPTLIVCPTSVVTNWTRELEQFTPDLPWFVQHGSGRRTGDALVEAAQRSGVVFTSYAVLARDIQALVDVPWRMVVLDEAQNIKNPSTRHSRAARSLRAPARVVLTGTPVENHVGDLWSIMEFLNPGLLGSQAEFRRRYLLPIQTGSFPEAVERLRQLTGPFILRREKTDRTVISDLPDKFERTDFCTMTAEQVGLYEAIVRDAEKILLGKANAAVERRGVILATLSKLKQACNHPAQLLADNSQVLGGRSGKLTRLEELIELVLESRERALVFTQFVGMGELLQKHLEAVFGREVLFLHGGTSRRRRDELVQRFQDADDAAPPILILSLKAGGSGLNLTAATHVIHYDRWWNPATEQQASDRAFRIGQTRDVQVHALVCAGTVEERIDTMLRQKASVARTVIGSGERWITELDDAELLGMLQLRQDTLLGQPEFDDVGRKWGRVSL